MADEPTSTPTPDLPIVEEAAPCRFLRNKGMYVYTDGSSEHDSDEDGYDNTVYWCLKTMKDIGPDNDSATGQDCRKPTRTCYEPT
jgi:hypothetical protein